jgi:hypothetical protein
MTDRASDRRSRHGMMASQMADHRPGRSAGKAPRLCATYQPKANNQRRD